MNETLKKLKNSPLAEKVYIVGGAVRDMIMNRDPEDVDFVVEATKEVFEQHFPEAEMVGNHFPVYLLGGNEVALTRTEKSTGDDHTSFEVTNVGVSIYDDLSRRDFTCNSIALRILEDGFEYVDPFNGIEDINKGILRTVFKSAFEEDPLRILRAARFAARFHFEIENETKCMMSKSADGLKYISKERIVKELEKTYEQSNKPSQFFEALESIGALEVIFPEISLLTEVPAGPSTSPHGIKTAFEHTMEAVDRCKKCGYSFHVFIAVLFHDVGKAFTEKEILPAHHGHELRSADISREFLENHAFSRRIREFVPKAAKYHMKGRRLKESKSKTLIKLARKIGKRDFDDFFKVCNCDHPFDETELYILSALKEVFFETDFSFMKGKKFKEPQIVVHEKLVSELKRKLRRSQ